MNKQSNQSQIQKWFEFAKEDFKMAQLALDELIFNSACFHAQQAVEKFLKALLLKERGIIPKTHSLEQLRLELEKINPSWEQLKKETRFLDQFYVPTRYPDALPGALPEGLPNKQDAKKSVAIASKIIKKASRTFK